MSELGVCTVLAALSLGSGLVYAGPDEAGRQEQEGVAESFAELAEQVSTGDTLYVIQRSGDEVRGELEGISEDGSSVTINVGGSPISIGHGQVQRIDQKYRDSVLNGVLIGAGVGFALGFLGESASECADDPNVTCGAGTAMTTGIGAGVGYVIDSMRQGRRTVFHAPAVSGARLMITPYISAKRKGVNISIRF